MSVCTTGAIQLANLATSILAARMLLPEGRGDLAAILLWPTIVGSVMSLSLEQSSAYFGAARPGTERRFASVGLLVSAPLSILATAAGVILAPFVMKNYNADVVFLTQLYMIGIPLSYISFVALGALRGLQSFGVWNAFRLVPHLGYVAAAAVAILFGAASVEGFAAASFAGMALMAAVGVQIVLRLRGQFLASMEESRDFVWYALRAHVASLGSLANGHLDKIVVALVLSNAELGIYVVALAVANVLRVVAATLAPLVIGRIASRSCLKMKARVFGRFFRFALAMTVGGFLLLMSVGQELLIAVFGQRFSAATDILPLLLIGTLSWSLANVIFGGLKAYEKLALVSYAEWATLFVQGVMLVVLVPHFGLWGAAAAVALSNVVGLTIALLAILNTSKHKVLALVFPRADDWRYLINAFWNGAPGRVPKA